jgi:hypothetical protein
MKHYIFIAAVFGIAICAPPAYTQTATLHGTVTDPSGAAVPGAKVTLSGAGTAKSANSDRLGAYVFTGLALGDYTVQAAAQGLALPAPEKLTLQAGDRALNLALEVSAMSEKVTVRENAAPTVSVDSSSNASALVLKGSDLDALSDDPDDLAADLQALAGPSAGPNGGSIFVDGFSGGELPPKESIREIRINANPFAPEYDKLGYGKIEIFTKPGSDKYRGQVDYNFAKDFWNSRNPYAPVKAPFQLDEFEGNAGGPLGKRASFTVDAQRNMVDNGSVTNAVTLNPSTLAPETFAGFSIVHGRYTKVSPRVDYQLSPNHTLMVRYGVTHSDVPDNGVGGFDLASRSTHTQFTNQTVQIAETAVLGSAVNETRFQFYRSATEALANSASPEIQVLGSFNGGGSQNGRSFDTQNSYELQNYTSMLHGAHALRFGVRLRAQTDDSVSPQNFTGVFTFGGGALEPVLNAQNQPVLDASGQPELALISSIERYRRTLLFQQMGYSPTQIRNLGGGATQFSINAGTAELAVHQMDAGLFAGDEWRVRPNVTLSLGLRYELQTNIHDWRDISPRIAVAWAPGATGKGRSKTVLRGGFGIFYDRFSLGNTLTADRFNGLVQQQYVVTNPDFFPNAPLAASLGGAQSTQVVYETSSRLRAPYIVQSAATIERQLPANTTLAVTYTSSHGVHLLRSEDINAPLPGTYVPDLTNSGVFPLGHPGPVFLMESPGIYNQNQMIANVNTKLNAGISMFGFYTLNYARSNTDGIGTSPANPYNWSGEYGPASTDVRYRVTVGGSISLKWSIRISPFLVAQTGAPFDITAGNDLYGTTLFNGRPGINAPAGKAGLIPTAYGVLDPNPSPGEALLSRNYGRAPGQISMNLRVAKVIGFGRQKGEGKAANSAAAPASGGMAVAPQAGGRGLGSLIGPPTTSHRYNLSIGLSIRNLLNHTNPGAITGNITSPYFGFANQVAGGPNGEGFYENANNRRLESQIRFTF